MVAQKQERDDGNRLVNKVVTRCALAEVQHAVNWCNDAIIVRESTIEAVPST